MDGPTLELLKQSLGLGSIPLVVIAVEQAKRAFPKWPGYAWPLCALVVAICLNVLVGRALGTDPYVAVVLGVVTGFLSMSAYDKAGKPAPRG